MKKISKTSKTARPARIPLSKPGLFSLVVNISRAAFTGGMLWFIFFAGIALAFLHINHLLSEHLLVLLVAAVAVTAFIRGIREWQYELDEYQRDLTEYRMNMADIRNKHQVKKDIVWDRH